LPALVRQYRENQPCPHILLKDFLDPESALSAAMEFPQATERRLDAVQAANENKLGMSKRELFPAMLAAVSDEFNSPEFVAWVSELTGIPGLMADPMLEAAACTNLGRAVT